nr:cytochrome P450 monooxygenase CYP9EK5 [Lasioderma serricorne]
MAFEGQFKSVPVDMSWLSVTFADIFTPLLLCTCLLFAYWLYKTFIQPIRFYEKRGVPYIKPWTVMMDGLRVTLFQSKLFIDMPKEYYNSYPNERYVGMFQMGTPSLVIRDIDLIKQLTIKDFDHFVDHMGFGISQDKDDLFSKNLAAMNGETWKEMRTTLSPAFTSSKMKNMFGFMDDCAKNFVRYFQTKKEDVIDVEVRDVVTKYTNDVIASASFGLKCDTLENPNNEFYEMGQKLTTKSFILMLKFFIIGCIPDITKLIDIPLFPSEVSKFFRRIVQETIKTREEQNIIRPDMIHLLMEAKKGRLQHDSSKTTDAGFASVEEFNVGKRSANTKMTGDDIAAQALIFFFGGFDTTATTMSFMALDLAKNPDVQERLQEEIDEVLESTRGNVTYDDVMKMKYLDQVISETLRMWTPGFQTDRACTKDYVIKPTKPNEKPYLMRKGELIMIPTLGIHFDPNYFPNPDKFDPDRFSDENKKNIITGTYLPFGVGPRNCIGSRFALLEIKVYFFRVLSKFSFVFTKNTKLPIKLENVGFHMRPKGGFQMGLKKRK